MITKFELFCEQHEPKSSYSYLTDKTFAKLIDLVWLGDAGKDFDNKGDLITFYQNKYNAPEELEKYINTLNINKKEVKTSKYKDPFNNIKTDFPSHLVTTRANNSNTKLSEPNYIKGEKL